MVNKSELIHILDMIYSDVKGVMRDESILSMIKDNGYLASALCDSLGKEVVTFNVDGKEYSCTATMLIPGFNSIKEMLYSFVEGLRDDGIY